ncbi:ComEC/Rec2 family competence protein [Sulfurimonas sp. HSL3-7]|uniref:ComEC/Rec2 family competence protein n=1 Tax=Sulfonitrofixus jiaomeiensis TaxID=3131938 RepID=UPI0031FA090A
MILSAPPLLRGREYLYFFLLAFSFLLFSLAAEFYHYAKLTQFDDAVIEVTVLKHYTKVKEGKKYDVLQLLSGDGAKFYITSKPVLKNLVGYRVTTWLHTAHIGFYDYLKGFAAKGRIISVERMKEKRYSLGETLQENHVSIEAGRIYGALFLALPLGRALQERFSYLGVSHLLAISGFHLGVLSLILFALLRWPYRLLQQCYFPYRHRNRDLFIIVAFVLGSYLFFLGDVASLLRAYVMLIVAYLLHDRGVKIVSMQTLFITLVLLLSLWPRLFFSVGLWLSIGGVYFIFLYLRYFSELSKYLTLFVVPVWVYLMMTPIALTVFGNYSLYHPLSVVWSILFTLFYPSALMLHAIGYGAAMDGVLDFFLVNEINGIHFELPLYWLAPYLLLALSALYSKKMLYLLLLVASGVSVATVYQVA